MRTATSTTTQIAAATSACARSERQAVSIDLAASQVIVSLYGQVHEVVIGELNESAFDLAAIIG